MKILSPMKRATFIIGLLVIANLAYSQKEIKINKGETKTLTASGGTGKIFKWYSGSCGGTFVEQGEKIKVTPPETTTYYGRWEDGSVVSKCIWIKVIVEPIVVEPEPTPNPNPSTEPLPPITIVVNVPIVNSGESTILSYSGGSGKTFKWYSESCGGLLVGEGNDFEVSPTKTTTYYGRWEDGDNVSECQTITVTVVPRGGTTKTYSFGKYEGSLKNGYPEGRGKMTYTKRVQIAKHAKDKDLKTVVHYAEAGDYFDGDWGNGDIVSGSLYDRNGIVKEVIFTSKRPNPYDISND